MINREIACGLDQLPDRALSIYATEGPGDYEPDPEDLARHPDADGAVPTGRVRSRIPTSSSARCSRRG